MLMDEEETVAQSLICEDARPVQSSLQFSSAQDPYAEVTYTDLTDEKELVTEVKCMAYVRQLLILVGKKCRVEGCEQDIDVSSHSCGFAVKLSWRCKNNHR